MAYVPDPTSLTEPTDEEPGSSAAAEFRSLKAYIHNTLLPLIGSGSLPLTGGTLTGQLVNTATAAYVLKSANGQVSATNADGTILTGYIQFNSGGGHLSIVSDAGSTAVELTKQNVASVLWDGTNFFPSVPNKYLGNVNHEWLHVYSQYGNFSGSVTAASFVGDGSQLTGISASGGSAAPTSSQITTALGYTPYNSANPSGYITGISSAQVTGALGYTPYNANSNPNGYISSLTGANVTAALGYTPYNSSNPSGFINTVSLTAINNAIGFGINTNAQGTKTVSTSPPTGTPVDGDLWYQI